MPGLCRYDGNDRRDRRTFHRSGRDRKVALATVLYAVFRFDFQNQVPENPSFG